jgi:hypothetical protein
MLNSWWLHSNIQLYVKSEGCWDFDGKQVGAESPNTLRQGSLSLIFLLFVCSSLNNGCLRTAAQSQHQLRFTLDRLGIKEARSQCQLHFTPDSTFFLSILFVLFIFFIGCSCSLVEPRLGDIRHGGKRGILVVEMVSLNSRN